MMAFSLQNQKAILITAIVFICNALCEVSPGVLQMEKYMWPLWEVDTKLIFTPLGQQKS